MKRFFLNMLACVMTFGAVAQDGVFTLSGVVEGLGPNVMYYLTDADGGVNDYGIRKVTDGRLDFSFNLKEVGYLIINFTPSLAMTIPAVPGESVTLGGDVNNCNINGSTLYKAYGEAMAGLKPFIDASQHFDFKKDFQDEITGKSSEEIFDLYQSKWRALSRCITDAAFSYIKGHSNQEVSMMLLNQLGEIGDLDKVADIVDVAVRGGRMKPYFEARKNQIKKTGFSNPLLDKPAPDFTLNDINDSSLSLNSLRGKWVVLDFWSMTCGNAVMQFPELKEIYSKYKEHVEIVGVDCEDDNDEWKTAVKSRYDLPWKNVNGSFDIDDSSNPFVVYGVTGFPTYFLITPSGKVAMMSVAVQDIKFIFDMLFD